REPHSIPTRRSSDLEDTYYRKFVAPLVASFDVYAKGFEIVTESFKPKPQLIFSELVSLERDTVDLFGEPVKNGKALEDDKVLFEDRKSTRLNSSHVK